MVCKAACRKSGFLTVIIWVVQIHLVCAQQQVIATNGNHILKRPYVDPDDFGAIHADMTFLQAGISQEELNTNFSGIGATLQDPVDWAAWQLAVNEAVATGKMIIAYGDYYWKDKQVVIPKFFKSLTITGASCYINVTGTNGSAVFFRNKPADNQEANTMVNSFVRIDGLQIGSRNNFAARTGIDLGPTYNSVYKGIDCFNLAEAIHLRFALNTEVEMCQAFNCTKGWTTDMGDWPDASNSNSQSNHSSFNHCRFSAGDSSDYAFGIYACSGWSVTNCIVEGFKVRTGIDWDAKGSPVVKGLSVFNTHFECVNGATEGFIKLRMQGGVAVIDMCYGQYPAYLVNATALNGTYPFIEVSHTLYWVPVSGKYFKNSGCNWALNYNDNMLVNPQQAAEKFAGKAPAYCPAPASQCGGNTVTVNVIPR